jgi:hypothetical protein
VFGFAEWDSWLSLILEGLLSLGIVVGLFFVVRRVNANAEADRQRYLQSRNSPTPEENIPPVDSQGQLSKGKSDSTS